MPERKLSYKVDVDTGTAVRDLDRLGKAGGDAGRDIADGFGKAESASKAALDALSAKLDETERDAKGLADAVAAIKAHLTVDVDDSKINQFAADLKNKMGVAFDDVTADAKEFADVLSRGVDMSRTTSEIRGVGDALDHTRGEADQSRSVLANMAGNTTQSLGALGGVVGDLGMGLGQIAEYATEGNISMQGLAQMAGPFAALTVVSLGLQQALGNIAETKAWERDQVDGYTDAINDAGDSIAAVLQMAEDGLTGRIRDESILGGLLDKEKTVDLIKLLDEAGLTLADVSDAIRSGASDRTEFSDWINGTTPEAAAFRDQFDDLANSGERYTPVMEAVLSNTTAYTAAIEEAERRTRVMASTVDSVNESLRGLRIDEDPLAVLSEGAIKFGDVMVDPIVLWHQLVEDLRDGQADTINTAQAIDTFAAAMGIGKEEVEALAIEQGKGVKAMADYQTHTKAAADAAEEAGQTFADTGRIVSGIEWSAATIDAAQTAMSNFFTEATRGKDAVAGVQAALDDLKEAHHTAGTLLPDLSTGDGRAFMESLETLGTSLIPEIGDAFDDSRGSVDTFKQKMDGLYLRTLAQLSDQLGISTEDAALLLRQIGQVPENWETQYDLIGDELAKTQLMLLQGVIEGLDRDVQAQIAYAIKMGDYEGAVDLAVYYGSKHPVVLPSSADMSGANADVNNFRKRQASVPIYVPVRATTGSGSSGGSGYSKSGEAQAVGATAAAPAMVSAAAAPAVLAVPTAAPGPVTINLSAGVVGNRYDLQRWLRAATREQQRLGRLS